MKENDRATETYMLEFLIQVVGRGLSATAFSTVVIDNRPQQVPRQGRIRAWIWRGRSNLMSSSGTGMGMLPLPMALYGAYTVQCCTDRVTTLMALRPPCVLVSSPFTIPLPSDSFIFFHSTSPLSSFLSSICTLL